MVIFDKDIVEDPLDDMSGIHKPNREREGPVVKTLNGLMRKEKGGSYHNQDPKTGHLSTSDGCKRKSYLNYVHKLDDDLDVPANDDNTNWTFSHGDAVHEMIQDMLLNEIGREYVTIEETVEYDLNPEYQIYGHADIVVRGLDSAEPVEDVLGGYKDILPETFSGFPSPFVIDIKTKSEFKYYNYGKSGHARTVPSEKNVMQLNGYMGILGAKYGCLLYYSKRNDHLEEYWVEYDDELFQEAHRNIGTVLDSVNSGEPAPRDPDGEYMCEKFCKWYKNGDCPGMEGVDPHENWEGDDDAHVYDHPEWA